MTFNNTQLVNVANYNPEKMVFSEPVSGSIPDSKPAINFKRIIISTKNDDGSVGELVLPTTRLFSFGVSENNSQETGKVNGYTFPICLYNKEGPSKEEEQWVETFNKIVEYCIDHMVEHRDEIDKFDLEKSDLKKFNPLYYKKEKHTLPGGKTVLRVVPGSGPTLYTKLIFSKKNDKFITNFFDTDDNNINPMDLLGKYCYAQTAIKIESIFIGNKISLQVKLYEAVVEPVKSGMSRLLAPKPKSNLLGMKSTPPPQKTTFNADLDDSDSDINDSDSEEKSPSPKKKVVRKRTKK